MLTLQTNGNRWVWAYRVVNSWVFLLYFPQLFSTSLFSTTFSYDFIFYDFFLRVYFLRLFFYEFIFYDFLPTTLFSMTFSTSLFSATFSRSLFSPTFPLGVYFLRLFSSSITQLDCTKMRSGCNAPVRHPKSTSGAGRIRSLKVFWFRLCSLAFLSCRTVALQVWPCVQNTYKKFIFGMLYYLLASLRSVPANSKSDHPGWLPTFAPILIARERVRFSLIYLRPEARGSESGNVGQFWQKFRIFFSF